MAEPSGQKAIVYLVGAVFFGLVAAGLSYLFLKSRERALIAELKGAEAQLVQVVIARQDLPKGMQVKLEYFDVADVPGQFVHPNVVRPENFTAYVGRFLNTDLQAGRTLVDSFLVESFPRDFSDLVAPGRRAITITVDEVSAFSGLMRPGNRIDLYVNIPTSLSGFVPTAAQPAAAAEGAEPAAAVGGAAGQLMQAVGIGMPDMPKDVILPVLQDVKVLATGTEPYNLTLDQLSYPQQRQGKSFTTVTIDVSPQQAALISIAQDKGDLIAVLRNRGDRGGADFTGVTPFDLVGNAREMRKIEAMRQAAAAVGATIDANGNWVTKDGKVINKEDIVLGADGSVTTKSGAGLAPSKAVRDAAAAAGATIDANGNWVTKDGKVIKAEDIVISPDGTVRTKDGAVLAPSEALKQAAAAAGATIDENGNWVTADGKVINAQDIVVAADGSIRTKDGAVLAPSEELKKAAAAAGATIDANGNWVTPDGKVIKAEDIVIGPDGTVATKSGKLLAAPGIRMNEKGEYVDANGKVIDEKDIVFNPDGTVQTKDDVMKAAGFTVNGNGDYVDAEGNVLKKDDVQVLANGTVITKDGTVLAGPKVTRTKDGFLVSEDGTVMTADGKVLQGATVDADGNVVTANGEVLTDPNLSVAADGTVRDRDGNVIAGVTGSNLPPGFVEPGARGTAAAAVQSGFVALTIGGSSKDGVATTTLLPVQPRTQGVAPDQAQ